MSTILQILKRTVILSLILMLLCGVLYPLAMTAVGQLLFPNQANGSMITVNGNVVGSAQIGQNFTDARFLKGRPSAYSYNTYIPADLVPDAQGNTAYAGVGSGSQNLAPTNPALVERVQADIDAFLAANPTVKREDIPTDLMTASGSGLDPHISPASAAIQLPAIAAATGLTEAELQAFVDHNTTGRLLGIFGEPTVNVLKTNIEIAAAIGMTA